MSLRQTTNKLTENTMKVVIGFAMALSIAPLAIVAVNGELYEDTTAEFLKANGMDLVEYTVHSDNAVTIVAEHDNSGLVLYEDEMGEYLANAGYNMTEFTPEGGRNGELLVVAEPVAQNIVEPAKIYSVVNSELVL